MSLSLRTRLTVAYGAVMALVLIIMSTVAIRLQRGWAQEQFDAELVSLDAAVSHAMQEEVGETQDLGKAVAEARMSTNVPQRATAILDPGGHPLGAHWHGLDPRVLPASLTDHVPQFMTVGSGVGWRVLVTHESSPLGDYLILVGAPRDSLVRQGRALWRVLVVTMPLLVLGAAGICWWVASAALRPVRQLADQADAITVHSADRRLDVPSLPEELGQLARAFNHLLERLQVVLEAQRTFMADASHELRTPASVIQTAAEVTLAKEARETWEYRDALTIIGEQSTRLSRIVSDMLALARVDVGAFRVIKHPLYLDEVVSECTRAAAILAGTKGVTFTTDVQSDIAFTGDERLLKQLVSNLLDNAVRYTPAGGSVTVTLSADENSAMLRVADTGIGIPEADEERIFRRFVRLDAARATSAGAGLGLAIARWIAEQHGGTLVVEPARIGAIFVCCLPIMNL